MIDFATLGGNYSTTEQNTGYTWIDGKIIYKKTINFGSLPDSTAKSVAHGISNLNYIVKIEGVTYNGTRFADLSAPGISESARAIQITIESGNVVISTGVDRTSDSAYVTLYYTKSN